MTMEAADARTVAVSLQTESFARRLDPITEIYAHVDQVNLTVCPTEQAVWDTWCNLFRVDPERTKWGRSMVNAVGTWRGVQINLRGLDTDRWYKP